MNREKKEIENSMEIYATNIKHEKHKNNYFFAVSTAQHKFFYFFFHKNKTFSKQKKNTIFSTMNYFKIYFLAGVHFTRNSIKYKNTRNEKKQYF